MAFDATRVAAIVGTNLSDAEKLAIIIDLLQTAGIIATPPAAGLGAGTAATATRVTHASDDPLLTRTPDLTPVSTASVTQKASQATNFANCVAANAARKGLILQNTDANDCYVKFGTTATTSDFTVKIPGNGGYWEMPYPIYTGRIDAIWSADGSGNLNVTEL